MVTFSSVRLYNGAALVTTEGCTFAIRNFLGSGATGNVYEGIDEATQQVSCANMSLRARQWFQNAADKPACHIPVLRGKPVWHVSSIPDASVRLRR